jgi:xanthine dehydrogenase accessory factor
MKELQDILRAYEEAEREGKQTALATVVHLEGSAYRRPGARMLVTEDGKLTGAISGGCLEGDALRKAQLVMVQKRPMLVKYDTTDDDDAKLGVGLGCNGIITILIEPVYHTDENNPIAFVRSVLSKRQSAVLATLFSLADKSMQPGTCMFLSESGEMKASLPDKSLVATLLLDAKSVLDNRVSITKVYKAETLLTGFVEYVEPAVCLVIFGAGNDTLPLVQMGNILGWNTTVVDGRPNYATSKRFPSANQVLVAKPANAIAQIDFDKNSAALLMTHNYNYDIDALAGLIPMNLPYVGVLGPKKKLERMLDELKEKGVALEDKIDNVFGPAGLDLGAETADEIALSIISEIKAVLSKRTGSSLRDRDETIHPRENQKLINEFI